MLHVRVDEILDHLLPAAAVGRGVAFFEHDFFERREAVLAGFDLGADAGVPAGVAVLEQFFELAVGAIAAAIFRPRAKASMPPMWAWNRSTGSKLSRRTLASKLTPPVVKPPYLSSDEHALRGQVDVGRELVGVPAEQHVAACWRRSSRARRGCRRLPARAASCGRRAWRGWFRCSA